MKRKKRAGAKDVSTITVEIRQQTNSEKWEQLLQSIMRQAPARIYILMVIDIEISR